MTAARRPQLGDYGVVRTGGLWAWLIRFGTRSKVNHAFVYVGDGMIVEAQPGGAVQSPGWRYSRITAWSNLNLTDAERADIVRWAKAQIGVPYGWPDIAALGLACEGIRSGWVAKRIEREDRLICSQLVDKAYVLAGVHLFEDGRLPGQVTPGDLYDLILDALASRCL
ncbi:MAG TPA: hypothetical protein VJ851_00765 [Jatrophihabitans sp.]|nr:hypothetical protein [Jatrophihabitans sp.]